MHFSTRNSTVFSAEWKLCTFPQGTAPSAPSTQFTTGGSRQCRAVLVRRSTDPTHIYDLYFLTFTNREAPYSTTHPIYWALPFGGGVGGSNLNLDNAQMQGVSSKMGLPLRILLLKLIRPLVVGQLVMLFTPSNWHHRLLCEHLRWVYLILGGVHFIFVHPHMLSSIRCH